MFFVYMETPSRIDVIGGTVSLKAAKLLAKKRSKGRLTWVKSEGMLVAEEFQGKSKTVYRIREKRKE